MLHLVGSLGQRGGDTRGGALARDGLAGLLWLAFCAGTAPAAEPAPSPQLQARDLAAEVLRETGNGGLGAWTRGVIDRALERAGTGARDAAAGAGTGAAPLPAERHAARVGSGLAGRPGASEVLVFMSLAVPSGSWRQWAREAASAGAPLVLRGVGEGGLRATVKAVGERLGGAEAGVAIDPRLFRLFGVGRVPAVAVVPGGVPPCASPGCAEDTAPAHDRVTGNIGLAAALEAVAAEGELGRGIARRTLQRLEGEH